MSSPALCKLVCFICAVCVICALFTTAIELPTFNLNFYSHEYDKYNIADNIHVPKAELMAVTARLLDYMRGAVPDLSVSAHVNGEPRQFFNQREEQHMSDVRRLIVGGYMVRTTALCVLVLGLWFLWLMRVKHKLITLARWVLGLALAFLALMLILVFLVSLDFNNAFVIFHKIFFTNDLWILDPQTDLLVNIVPERFFIDLGLTVSFLFTAFYVIAICVCAIFLRLSKRRLGRGD